MVSELRGYFGIAYISIVILLDIKIYFLNRYVDLGNFRVSVFHDITKYFLQQR